MRSNCSHLTAVLALGLITAAAPWAHATDGDQQSGWPKFEQTLAQSQRSGKPVLAVAGRKDCGACLALKKRFETDLQLQRLLDNFVLMYVDQEAEAEAFGQWSKQFPTSSRAIPVVYVIRADGKALHADSPPPAAALEEFLVGMLREGGLQLSERQKQQMTSAASAARSLVDEGQLSAAISKLKPMHDSGSFDQSAQAVDKLWQQIEELLAKKVAAAEKQLAGTDETVQAAVILLETVRACGKAMPEVTRPANRLIASGRKAADTRELFKQADLIDKANAMAARGSKSARGAYQAVIDKFPDTPAARLAAEALAKVD